MDWFNQNPVSLSSSREGEKEGSAPLERRTLQTNSSSLDCSNLKHTLKVYECTQSGKTYLEEWSRARLKLCGKGHRAEIGENVEV